MGNVAPKEANDEELDLMMTVDEDNQQEPMSELNSFHFSPILSNNLEDDEAENKNEQAMNLEDENDEIVIIENGNLENENALFLHMKDMGIDKELITYVMKINPTVSNPETLTNLIFENQDYFEQNIKNKKNKKNENESDDNLNGIVQRLKKTGRRSNKKRKRSESDEESENYEPENKKMKTSQIQNRNRKSLYDSDESDDDQMDHDDSNHNKRKKSQKKKNKKQKSVGTFIECNHRMFDEKRNKKYNEKVKDFMSESESDDIQKLFVD